VNTNEKKSDTESWETGSAKTKTVERQYLRTRVEAKEKGQIRGPT